MCGILRVRSNPYTGYRLGSPRYPLQLLYLEEQVSLREEEFPVSRGFFFVRWVAGGMVRIALATAAGKNDRARAFRLGLRDGMSGRFGDRNDLFFG